MNNMTRHDASSTAKHKRVCGEREREREKKMVKDNNKGGMQTMH
jgi:hypothetical protein